MKLKTSFYYLERSGTCLIYKPTVLLHSFLLQVIAGMIVFRVYWSVAVCFHICLTVHFHVGVAVEIERRFEKLKGKLMN